MEENIAIKLIEELPKRIAQVFKWAVFGWIAYMAKQSIEHLADKVTMADIKLALTADVNTGAATCNLAWYITGTAVTLAACGIIYGNQQRNLRYDKTAQMSYHSLELEKIIDPGRSSSELDKTGQTPKED